MRRLVCRLVGHKRTHYFHLPTWCVRCGRWDT